MNEKKNMNMKDDHNFRSLTARGRWTSTFVPQHFQGMNLSDYPQDTDQHRSALQAAQRYAAGIRAGVRRPLYIFGRQGTGKTMLASCVWNELAPSVPDRHSYEDAQNAGTADNIAFVTGAGLVTWYRPDPQDESHTPAQRKYHIATCYLAVLDDLDKHPTGEWSNELFAILDSRMCHYRRPTIITSNLSPAALPDRYGEVGASITDRLIRAGAMVIRLDEKLVQPSVAAVQVPEESK